MKEKIKHLLFTNAVMKINTLRPFLFGQSTNYVRDTQVIECYGHIIFKSALYEIMYLLLFEQAYLKLLKKYGIGILTIRKSYRNAKRKRGVCI